MKKELLTYKDPKSPVSEVFRTLRTNIQFMNTNRKMKTLLVTSTFPAEGKSWVTSNLAVTFAQAGKKVILIDADMRKGRQFKIFDVLPKPGLSNYLSNMDSEDMETENVNIANYIQETGVDNLHVLVAGNVPPNPSELLVSTRMRKLLQELKEMCDLIIIDGTPCDLVTDSIILSRFVDSTIIVTAQKETKKDNLERIVKNIQNVGGRIAGIVVNKVDISTRKYNQQYYYGSISASNISKSSKHSKKTDDTVANIFKFLQKDDEDKSIEDKNTEKDEDVEIKNQTDEVNEQIKTIMDEFVALEDDNKNENKPEYIEEQEKINDIQKELEQIIQENQNTENEQIINQENNIEEKIEEQQEQYDKENYSNDFEKTVTNNNEKKENEVQEDTFKSENIDVPEVRETAKMDNYQNYNNKQYNNSYNKKHKNKYRSKDKRKEKYKNNNYSHIDNNDYNKIYNYSENEETNNYENYENKETNNHEKYKNEKTNNYEQYKNDVKEDSQQEQLNNMVEMAESAKNMTQDKANEIMNLVNSYIESEKQKQERKY